MAARLKASRQLSMGNIISPPTRNSSAKSLMDPPSTASKRLSEASTNGPPAKLANLRQTTINMLRSDEPVIIDDENTSPSKTSLGAKVEELFKSHFGMLKNGLAKFKGEFQDDIKAKMDNNALELKKLIQDEIFNAKRELRTSISASVKTGRANSRSRYVNENELQYGSVRYMFTTDKLRREKALRSPKMIIGRSEWYLCIKNIGDSLRVILCCNMDSDEFSYDTNGRYVLFGQKRAEFEFKHCYAFKPFQIPVLQYLFDQLNDSANGHISADNHVTVQADFSFKRVRNSPEDVHLFSAPMSFRSDCVLVVEDKRLHVNKGLLSVYSAYFDEFFNGDPGTNQSKEIVLTDVTVTELTAMLSAIYPTKEQFVITESNVRSMLKLADQFYVPFVARKCEKFLMTCPNGPDEEGVALGTKLALSQKYRLDELKNWCISQFKSPADLKALQMSEEFENLDGDILRAILKNINW